jgi:hypothetical protein
MNGDPKFSSIKIFFLITFFVLVGVFISSAFNKNSLQNQATVVSPNAVWDTHQVKGLQSSLKSIGYYSGAINGNFTALTRRALREFQKSHNLKPSGIVSPQTINELNEVIISENVSRSGESLGDGGDNPPMMQMMGGGTNCGINFFDPGQSGIIDTPYQVHAFYDPTAGCLWDIDPVSGKVIDFYLYNWDWQVGGVGALYTTDDSVPDGFSIPPGTIHLTGTILPTGNLLTEGTYMTPSNWVGTKNGQPDSYMGFWLSYSPGFSNIDTGELACLENSEALILFLGENPGVVPPPFCSQSENYTASNYICEPPVVSALPNSPDSITNGISGNQLVYEGTISSNSPGSDTPCDVLIQSVTVGLFADGAVITSFDVTGSEGVFTDTGMFPTPLIDTFSLGTTSTTKLELSITPPNNSETISIMAKDIVIPAGVSSITAGPIEAMYKFSWEPGGASRKVIFSNSLETLNVGQ